MHPRPLSTSDFNHSVKTFPLLSPAHAAAARDEEEENDGEECTLAISARTKFFCLRANVSLYVIWLSKLGLDIYTEEEERKSAKVLVTWLLARLKFKLYMDREEDKLGSMMLFLEY